MKTRSLRLLVVVALACPLVACAPVATAGQLVLIANGVRNTVAGARIDAHSGTILRASDGRFYWYGERYGCGFYWNDPASPYCGVQVYSSRDLVNWDGPWPAFNAGTGYWQDLCMHVASAPGNGCFRPKVVFNPRTQLYVLWLNTPETDDGYRVLTSHAPRGRSFRTTAFRTGAAARTHATATKGFSSTQAAVAGSSGIVAAGCSKRRSTTPSPRAGVCRR